MYKKVSLIIIILVFTFIGYLEIRFSSLIVPQGGMVPNILPGEKFWIDKYAYKQPNQLQYGDVVVFRDKIGEYLYVWRLIGKPGDTIAVEEGIPIINGKKALISKAECKLPDAFSSYECYTESLTNKTYRIVFQPETRNNKNHVTMNVPMLVIPEGKFFFLGDCRNCAMDSRHSGVISFAQVIGKAKIFIAGSVHRFGDEL